METGKIIAALGLAFLLPVLLAQLEGCSVADGALMTPEGAIEPHHFSAYRGKRLYINYWAEWCAPCREEIPELNELAAVDGHSVLGRNFDDLNGEELLRLIREMGIEFPVLLNDPAVHFQQKLPSVLPTTFVIDETGALRAVLVGPQTVASLTAAGEA